MPASGQRVRRSRLEAVMLSLVIGAAWAGIMAERLFVGGTVGMADNSDGRRLMCQLGVRVVRPFYADPLKYAYPVWTAHRWYGEACGADGSGEPYRSSQLWLMSLAKHLTPILGFSGTLDLRAMGVLASLLVGLGVGLLVAFLPGRWWIRVLVGSAFGLVMADSAIADYFVSPYSEAGALLGALFLVAALLWMWRKGTTTWPGLVAIALFGAFTMAAKTQAIAWLPALALAVLWLPHHGTQPGPLRDGRGVRHILSGAWSNIRRRLPGLVTSVALAASAIVILQTAPQRFDQLNAYNEVFNEILIHSPNPRSDLRALGADPNMAYARGSNILSANSAANSLSYLKFRSHVTQTRILEFYLIHPQRLFPVFGDGLHAMSVWRENYLGSYTAGSNHPPGALENRVTVFTNLFHGAPSALFVILWLSGLGFGFFTSRDRRAGPRERAVGRVAVVLATATAVEFWAVMLGEGGADTYKHMILANELFAFGVIALWFCIVSRFRARLRLGALDQPATVAPQAPAPPPPPAPASPPLKAVIRLKSNARDQSSTTRSDSADLN